MKITKIWPIDSISRDKRKKDNVPTGAQRHQWNKIAELGCIIADCGRPATIHHCGTGGGGRKDHDYVIPLCLEHHTGRSGIDGQVLSKRGWQVIYGSEMELWLKMQKLLQR